MADKIILPDQIFYFHDFDLFTVLIVILSSFVAATFWGECGLELVWGIDLRRLGLRYFFLLHFKRYLLNVLLYILQQEILFMSDGAIFYYEIEN